MTTLLTPPDLAPVDDVRRREFLGILVAAGLLTGCGADDAPDGGAEEEPTTRRVVDGAGRTVDVPTDPRRLVVLDPSRALVDAAALGIVPVGGTINTVNPGGRFPPVIGAAADSITSVGLIGEADVEQIAALRPDLILFATAYQDTLGIETLAEIAPVVAYERPQFGLVEPLRFFGEMLNRRDAAARLERDYLDAIARRRASLGLEGRTVAVLNLPEDTATEPELIGPGQGFHPALAGLGAVFAPADYADVEFQQLSLELLATELAEADLVIGLRYATGESAFIDSPVWRGVPAVGRGDVAYLDGQEAFGNFGLSGIEAALDDLADQLI